MKLTTRQLKIVGLVGLIIILLIICAYYGYNPSEAWNQAPEVSPKQTIKSKQEIKTNKEDKSVSLPEDKSVSLPVDDVRALKRALLPVIPDDANGIDVGLITIAIGSMVAKNSFDSPDDMWKKTHDGILMALGDRATKWELWLRRFQGELYRLQSAGRLNNVADCNVVWREVYKIMDWGIISG